MVKPTKIIVVAAGSGRRFGSPLPKQFCLLDGVPVLVRNIRNLRVNFPDETEIILVLNRDYFETWEKICNDYDFHREDKLVEGGICRAESVSNALDTIDSEFDGVIMVHDGVRPFVSRDIVYNLFSVLTEEEFYAIPAVPVSDSLRKVEKDGESLPVNRALFRAVQTPQAFPAKLLKQAYKIAKEQSLLNNFTDDASVVNYYNPKIKAVLTEGSPYNIKITNPLDLRMAETLLRCATLGE